MDRDFALTDVSVVDGEEERTQKMELAKKLHELILSDQATRDALSKRTENSKFVRCVIIFYLGTWLPAYYDPAKRLASGQRYFTMYRDLPKVAKDHRLPFDDTRPDPSGNQTLRLAEESGHIRHESKGNMTIWFITRKGEQFIQELHEYCFEAEPPSLPAALAPLEAIISQLREFVLASSGQGKVGADERQAESSHVRQSSLIEADGDRKILHAPTDDTHELADKLRKKMGIQVFQQIVKQQEELTLSNKIVGLMDDPDSDFVHAFKNAAGQPIAVKAKHAQPLKSRFDLVLGQKNEEEDPDTHIRTVIWTDGEEIFIEFHFPDGYVQRGTSEDLMRALHTTKGGVLYERDECAIAFFQTKAGQKARLIKIVHW